MYKHKVYMELPVIAAIVSGVPCPLNAFKTSIPHSLGCITDLRFHTTNSQLTGLVFDGDSSQQLLCRTLFYDLE